jgi:hypothetical protein
MFNKKLINVLCWILQIMVVAKTLFELVMYVWGLIAGTPPIGIFQQGVVYGSFLSVLLLLQVLGGNIFAYITVAVLKAIADGAPLKKR